MDVHSNNQYRSNILIEVLKSLISKLTFIAVLAIVVTLAASAQAAPVYDTPVAPANFSGSRVYQDAGVDGQATISWDITDNGGSFTYRYTIDIPAFVGGNGPFFDLSHLTIDVSDNLGPDDLESILATITTNAAEGLFDPLAGVGIEDLDLGDFDGLTSSLKLDFGGGKSEEGVLNTTDGELLFFEFTVARRAVWGNFAIKSDTLLTQNQALLDGTVFTSEDIGDFIAVPDTFIPEPSSFVLAALGLCMLLGFRRRRRSG